MKTKIVIGLLLLITSFSTWADLRRELKIKTQNYNLLIDYYSRLAENIEDHNSEEFCRNVTQIYPTLIQILEDDSRLIKELHLSQNQDYFDYATHLEDNIASPLFAHQGHQSFCQHVDPEVFPQMLQSMKYNVMNSEYLKLTHEMWIQGYGSSTL